MEAPACVVIKWGGGLITDKSQLCTVREDVIESLALVVKQIQDAGLGVILVHGAGSFGHLRARGWRLAEGRIEGHVDPTDADCNSQDEAVELVRRDMMTLNSSVVTGLAKAGCDVEVHPPHRWASNTGAGFEGNVQRLSASADGPVVVTWGDVTDCDAPKEFGILSGDDLVYRIATEIDGIASLIFAIGDVPGLMSAPPSDPTSELLSEWSPADTFEGQHASEQDVTGGIFLKAERAAAAAGTVPSVWFVDGRVPLRILEAATGGEPIGTRIRA